MESDVRTALLGQYGAAIDELERAIDACPPELWTRRLWPAQPHPYFSPRFGEFWCLAFHTIVWLDLYGKGISKAAFSPPAPFTSGELDSKEATPAEPYSKDDLLGYLRTVRESCRTTLEALTGDQARRIVDYPWAKDRALSYLELQLYNLRHLQEHAAQLNLFLGQNGVLPTH